MKQITLETTNICNAKCIPCPRESYTFKKEIMDWNLFTKIINDASNYDIELIEATGFGDPLLDKLFFERCKYIKEKLPNTKIYITSTCNSMTDNIIDKVIEYVDMLKISLYGTTKETYEKVHGINYEKSIENINNLLKKRKSKPYIIGSYLMLEENKEEKDEWIKLWEDKFNELIIWMPHNWAGLKNYREIDSKAITSCGRPLSGPPYIHVDGTVSICCWDINKKLVIGNLKTQDFQQIYKSAKYGNILLRHTFEDFENILCGKCCQINNNPEVLVYSNKSRKVGEMTSNKEKLK